MKILRAVQIRQADAYTIKHEPIKSINLMERAANKCMPFLLSHYVWKSGRIKIFCGPGNNGGDGLAIARMVANATPEYDVYIIRGFKEYSKDFLINEKRFKKIKGAVIHNINSVSDIPELTKKNIIIDAIFGTGLDKPVTGLTAKVIEKINRSGAFIISIDMPSGLFADRHAAGDAIVRADETFSFQFHKLAFLLASSGVYAGKVSILDIGLNNKYIESAETSKQYIEESDIKALLKPRPKFSHKGTYGHALLFAGSIGKVGAAVMATKACVRTGAGLTTVSVSVENAGIMQVSSPEVMVETISNFNFDKYSAIGMGPGIGNDFSSRVFLRRFITESKLPLVIDADALNILSERTDLLRAVPPNSILTPHPKEFARLAGESTDSFDQHQRQINFSKKHKVFVVLKGANTCISTPDGRVYFNSTGNAGMAKGGSGDVLTGMITSLLAQGYSSLDASLIGVYLHGLAGDMAAESLGMDGMIPSDIIEFIPQAWKKLREKLNEFV